MPISRSEELGFDKSHAIVIGINEYRGLSQNLDTAVSDAESIAIRLKVLQGFDNVLLLKNIGKEEFERLLHWLRDNANNSRLNLPGRGFAPDHYPYRSEISQLKFSTELAKKQRRKATRKTFEWNEEQHEVYFKSIRNSEIKIGPSVDGEPANESIVFYFAGHGFPGEFKDGPAGFLAPTDARKSLSRNVSMITMDEVYSALSAVNCKHTLLILDCCFAGNFKFAALRGEAIPNLMPLYQRRYERFKKGIAWQVLVSSGPDELANDSADWANIRRESPFAHTFIKALDGRADVHTKSNKTRGDGIITALEIYLYVWDEVERITSQRIPQHPELITMEQHQTGEFIFLNPHLSAPPSDFVDDPDINPYKGLLPYEPEDADLFFGRDKAIESFLRKIPFQQVDTPDKSLTAQATPKVIFLSAPSATGKTSLVKAGLFPAMQKKYGYEELLVFRPAAIGQIAGQSFVAKAGEPVGHYEKTAWTNLFRLQFKLDINKRQMILIDQFEEFFTDLNERERTVLENQLIEIIEHPDEKREQPLVLVFAMRSDVEWQMPGTRFGKQQITGKPGYWNRDHIFRLIRMNLEELRKALTAPAWWALYDFKNQAGSDPKDDGEELINQIITDVAYFPAPLPWLSSVMYSFYELAKKKENQRLIKADYDYELKGVNGAMSANAEELIENLLNPELDLNKRLLNALSTAHLQKIGAASSEEIRQQAFQKIVVDQIRQMLLRMVNVTDTGYSRRKVTYSESFLPTKTKVGPVFHELDFGEDAPLLKILIDEMEKRHLLVQGDNYENAPTVEPAHDALFKFWPRCRQWLADFGKENLLMQRQLWASVTEHYQSSPISRDPRYPRGSRSDTSIEEAVEASSLWDRSPKLEQLINSLCDPYNELNQPEYKPTCVFIEHIWAGTLPKASIADAKKAVLDWLVQAEVIENTASLPRLKFGIHTADGLFHLLLDHGHHWLNRAEVRFLKESWQRRNNRMEQLINQRNEANFSLAKLFEERSDEALQKQLPQEAWLYNLAALSKEIGIKNLPTAIGRLMLPVIRPHVNYQQGKIKFGNKIRRMAVDQEKGLMAIGGSGFQIKMLNLKNRQLTDVLSLDLVERGAGLERVHVEDNPLTVVWDLAFHPFENKIAFCVSAPNDYIIRDAQTGPQAAKKFLLTWNLTPMNGPRIQARYIGGKVNDIAFSPNGNLLALTVDSKAIFIYRTPHYSLHRRISAQQINQSLNHANQVITGLGFMSNEDRLISCHSDGSVLLWDLSNYDAHVLYRHNGAVRTLLFLPEEHKLMTGGDDRQIKIWDFENNGLAGIRKVHTSKVQAIGKCGHQLLYSVSGKLLRIWNRQNGQLLAEVATKKKINDLAFDAAGQLLVLGLDDGEAQFVNLKIDLFDNDDEALQMEGLISQPWSTENKEYIQKLYEKSLDKLSYDMNDWNLRVRDIAKAVQANIDYFGKTNTDQSAFQFKRENLYVFANPAAQKTNSPEIKDGSIILTKDKNPDAGTAIFLKSPIAPPFMVEFEFKISNKEGAYRAHWNWRHWPADGLSFIFLKDLDKYDENIPSGPANGFVFDGTGYRVYLATFGKNNIFLNDGFDDTLATAHTSKMSGQWKPIYSHNTWRTVKIQVTAKRVTVYYEGLKAIDYHGDLDLEYHHIGFGAGNGRADAEHSIRNIKVAVL
ncbi:MAG: caspase family protein [Bacteroidota bacterium]